MPLLQKAVPQTVQADQAPKSTCAAVGRSTDKFGVEKPARDDESVVFRDWPAVASGDGEQVAGFAWSGEVFRDQPFDNHHVAPLAVELRVLFVDATSRNPHDLQSARLAVLEGKTRETSFQ
jgi:hypothetical protein